MGFWSEFVSQDSSVVHSPTVVTAFIMVVLATPIVTLACATVIFHVFMMRKGLDIPTVHLLLGLLGAATGGLGASFFARPNTTTIATGIAEDLVPLKAKPAPPGD